MDKKFKSVIIMICTLFMAVFIQQVYARDLFFEADTGRDKSGGEGLKYTTFVKALDGSTDVFWIPKAVSSQNGEKDFYHTKYITFHASYGTQYSDAPTSAYRGDKMLYFDDSGGQIVTSSNYGDYDKLVHKGSTYLAGAQDKREIYSTYDEDPEYAAQVLSSYLSADGTMKVTNFYIQPKETNEVINKIKENKNILDFSDNGREVYVKMSNVTHYADNGNMHNGYIFYTSIPWGTWNWSSWGTATNSATATDYQAGKSALNNYDNVLKIPLESDHTRRVYVSYKLEDGTLFDVASDNYQYLVRGQYEDKLSNQNLSDAIGTEWQESYEINPDDGMKVAPRKGDQIIHNGRTYEVSEIKIQQGPNFDQHWNVAPSAGTTTVTINSDTTINTDYTYITYVYKEVEGVKVYVKHVDKDTGEIINELKRMEYVADFIGLNTSPDPAPSIYKDETFQTKYTFANNRITCGPIGIPTEFRNGSSYLNYVYDSYSMSDGPALDLAAVSSSPETGNSESVWVKGYNGRYYVLITFYYKKGGKNRELYTSHAEYSTSNKTFSNLKLINGISTNISPNNRTTALLNTNGFQKGYSLPSEVSYEVTNGVDSSGNISAGGQNYKYKGIKAINLIEDVSGLNTIKSKISELGLNKYSGANISVGSSTTKADVTLKPISGRDITAIVFFYEPSGPTKGNIDDLEFTGRLEFVGKGKYVNSTSGAFKTTTADYIPATKELKPYMDKAYPYIVRAMSYSSKTESKTLNPTVTLKKKYYYTTTSTDDKGNSKIKVHSGSKSKTYDYDVDYTFKYYRIDNLKMYRISKMTLIDKESNEGGRLFTTNLDEETYNIGMSSKYESRFDGGIKDRILKVSVPNKTYTLRGSSGSTEDATSAVNGYTEATAASYVGLKITYEYSNEYVLLDKKEDMLDKNYNPSKSEWISEANPSFTFDSTNCSYTNNLLSYMKPTSKLTDAADFEDIYLNVNNNNIVKDNGVRLPEGELIYTLEGGKFYRGGKSFASSNYTYKINTIETITTKSSDFDTTKYSVKGDANVRKVDVLTPLAINTTDSKLMETTNSVDQTLGNVQKVLLQKGVEFKVTPNCINTNMVGYSSVNTNDFVKYYYIMCDFTVRHNGTDYDPYHAFKVAKGDTFTGIPVDIEGNSSVSQSANNIYIIAASINIPPKLEEDINSFFSAGSIRSRLNYITSLSINKDKIDGTYYFDDSDTTPKSVTSEETQSKNGKLTKPRKGASNHLVWKKVSTTNIGRIYDFKITDCTDLAFKDVFRKKGSNNVNEGTETEYFSGNKKWIVGDIADNNNAFISREEDTIIPLGPYKNTTKSYISSPKLGYRFSFDLKTTGYYDYENTDNKRSIKIYPRYYYIKKDGKGGIKDNITLYYKDTNGKYSKLTKYTKTGVDSNYTATAGSNYSIYFKPNDEYRYISNSDANDLKLLSPKLEKLKISSNVRGNVDIGEDESAIMLNTKMMSTSSDLFIQAWYGEFKLPNSTIAVDNDDSDSTVNNPLNDGYIGVIFDIYCVDELQDGSKRILSYSKNNKSAEQQSNTTQWDYEGFLKFNSPGGDANNMKLQLEKGLWTINNDTYNKIKGTVILYDTDSRAANDFN